ncbi:TonB C-terminal domain-containing protein [Campylobacter corcagiensis]|uniref:TonB C-terminal domain-containing protein n=1 Tax=Campylobacter corcagiensis TaxID=1448857 RepID=A0A7M1LE79_9BACT|nr:TonB C-terminal domain-containing protein [Campylobacter corcagiensis]QKF65242.1 Tol-Pal system subunit TolA [Campylobacter corcagiensis]QOQ86623.1 TonB C-terminal domain-containing protein [Campylobacter corcagiensis]
MQKTIDILSFIISLSIYIISLICVLYLSNKAFQNLENVRYTDDINATRDQVTIADIDDLIPAAPEDALEKPSEIKAETEEEVEEEKLKTTHKKPDEASKPKQEQPKPEPKKEEPAPNQDSTEPIKIAKEEPKLLDLFSDINSTKINEAAKSEESVQSRKKSDNETKVAKEKSTSSQKSEKKSEKSSGKTMSTGVYNKFRGEVQNILTRVWTSYRAIPNQDATVKITISPNGKLSYEITQLAYDSAFNQKFRDFLSKLEGMNFPKPPNGQPFTHTYKMADLAK